MEENQNTMTEHMQEENAKWTRHESFRTGTKSKTCVKTLSTPQCPQHLAKFLTLGSSGVPNYHKCTGIHLFTGTTSPLRVYPTYREGIDFTLTPQSPLSHLTTEHSRNVHLLGTPLSADWGSRDKSSGTANSLWLSCLRLF